MIKRLIVGLLLGAVIGAAAAAMLVQGLGISSFATSGGILAYLAAAVTGAVTGLVAGKPIWSADGKIEAGLKSFFGALLALGGMFALRTWAPVDVDLSMLKAGHGHVGDLPAASLPVIAAVLAAFFELDNTSGGASSSPDDPKDSRAKLGAGSKVRVAGEGVAEEEDDVEEASAKKKAR
jgi:hypothetical protein